MVVGEYKGSKVQDIKKLLQKSLIAANDGLLYYEPESRIISRLVSLIFRIYIYYVLIVSHIKIKRFNVFLLILCNA